MASNTRELQRSEVGEAAVATRRICAFVPYPVGSAPSQRFRIEQWTPRLAAAGIHVDLRPFAPQSLVDLLYRPGRPFTKAIALAVAFARRLRSMSLDGYDAVLVHRAISLVGPAVLERLISAHRPLIFDFDDAIFLTHTTRSNRRFGWLKFSRKTATICRLSAHVIAGNEYLAAFARQHAARVSIIPSSVDTDRYCPVIRPVAERLVVGWMGSSTSQTHLELFVPVLRELSRRRPIEIRIVSDRRPALGDVAVVWRQWRRETELEDLQAFDIGIMPMPNDKWAEGKCAMKALLYMSVGVPTVCSAVGMNREVIRDDDNGFLADSEEAWLKKVLALVDDPMLRSRLGRAGRATVEARFSTDRCASLFAGVIDEAIADRR